jgi:hypothetical protein
MSLSDCGCGGGCCICRAVAHRNQTIMQEHYDIIMGAKERLQRVPRPDKGKRPKGTKKREQKQNQS